jgi:hypothetical protein
MDLDRRPTGLFVCVADEYIAHDDWLEYFASKAVTGLKPVRCKGEGLPGWNRLKVLERKPILDEMCFAWISSVIGVPSVTDYGEVWFSTTEEPVTETVVNDRGRGDYGELPCYILSEEGRFGGFTMCTGCNGRGCGRWRCIRRRAGGMRSSRRLMSGWLICVRWRWSERRMHSRAR